MSKRIKNIYFVIGLIGVILTASGISPETITSWDILFKNIINIISNPFMLMSVVMSVLGIFVDPTTPGIKDNHK